MQELPLEVLGDLSADDKELAVSWWQSLQSESRQDFTRMWDGRSEDTALFGTVENGALTWHSLPIELVGQLTDDDNTLEHDELKEQLLEYVNNHEDIQFFLVERSFHICRAHPIANRTIASGLIPSSFQCPNQDKDCPMLAILAHCEGQSIRLDVRPKRLHRNDGAG